MMTIQKACNVYIALPQDLKDAIARTTAASVRLSRVNVHAVPADKLWQLQADMSAAMRAAEDGLAAIAVLVG